MRNTLAYSKIERVLDKHDLHRKQRYETVRSKEIKAKTELSLSERGGR
jgi:hypothetical protein